MAKLSKDAWSNIRGEVSHKVDKESRDEFGNLIQGFLDEGGVSKQEAKDIFKYLEKNKGKVRHLSDKDKEIFREKMQERLGEF